MKQTKSLLIFPHLNTIDFTADTSDNDIQVGSAIYNERRNIAGAKRLTAAQNVFTQFREWLATSYGTEFSSETHAYVWGKAFHYGRGRGESEGCEIIEDLYRDYIEILQEVKSLPDFK